MELTKRLLKLFVDILNLHPKISEEALELGFFSIISSLLRETNTIVIDYETIEILAEIRVSLHDKKLSEEVFALSANKIFLVFLRFPLELGYFR